MTSLGTSTELPAATELALDRTRLAHERTLMAWTRTGMSLITFGFSIYKFFQSLIDTGYVQQKDRAIGPRGFGLVLIGMGLFSLLLATISNRRDMQELRRKYGYVPYSLAALPALVISIFGILVLLMVILRL